MFQAGPGEDPLVGTGKKQRETDTGPWAGTGSRFGHGLMLLNGTWRKIFFLISIPMCLTCIEKKHFDEYLPLQINVSEKKESI